MFFAIGLGACGPMRSAADSDAGGDVDGLVTDSGPGPTRVACGEGAERVSTWPPAWEVGRISAISTGTGFAAVVTDQKLGTLYFVRVGDDGALIPGSATLVVPNDAYLPSMAWSGTEFGIAYHVPMSPSASQIHFVRLDALGHLIPQSDVVVSSKEDFEFEPAIAWDPNAHEWVVVWNDGMPDDRHIRLVRVDDTGRPIPGSEVQVDGPTQAPANTPAIFNSSYPAPLQWAGDRMLLTWYAGRHLYVSAIAGRSVTTPFVIEGAAASPLDHSIGNIVFAGLAATASSYGVVWLEVVPITYEFIPHFARGDANGYIAGSDVILDADDHNTEISIASSGSEYGLVWKRSSTKQLRFVQMDGSGTVTRQIDLPCTDRTDWPFGLVATASGFRIPYTEYSYPDSHTSAYTIVIDGTTLH